MQEGKLDRTSSWGDAYKNNFSLCDMFHKDVKLPSWCMVSAVNLNLKTAEKYLKMG